MKVFYLSLLSSILALVQETGSTTAAAPSTTSINSGLRLLYQNDLDWRRASDSGRRQTGYLLLTDPLTPSQAASSCHALGEELINVNANQFDSGLQSQLSYLLLDDSYGAGQQFWIQNNKAIQVNTGTGGNVLTLTNPNVDAPLPSICTQSAPWNFANSTDTNSRWQVATSAQQVSFTGYRDALSFRFLQVPFANPTERFTYSNVYNAQQGEAGSSISALTPGRNRQCPQRAGTNSKSDEQCLVANVFTPHLPSPSSVSAKKGLKPVLLWIHGGGYTSGSGLDITFDGGNLASRSDIVVVTTNYRLGTLGHLTYNDQVRGNYGLGDLVTALKWIQQYGPAFGGDPNRVTIAGQSAGAQHVENLLASPAAANLFQQAIIHSGKAQDKGFTYTSIADARNGEGGSVVKKLGCDKTNDVLACLRRLDTESFLSNVYSSISQDGTYIDSPRLDLRPPGLTTGNVNRVKVISGHMRDELVSLGTLPSASETDLSKALSIAGVSENNKQIVLNNPNIFPPKTYGIQNLIATVNTDLAYRCGIEAMAYAAVENQVFPVFYHYVYDQRAFQIPNYDPNAVCQVKGSNLAASSNYMCHSGDLLTIFHTNGIAFKLAYRDPEDLPWMQLIMDQFSSFIRTGVPTPSREYLVGRGPGYQATLDRATQDSSIWQPLVKGGNKQALSFGPTQRMVPLAEKGEQCTSLGKSIDYLL